MIGIHDFRSLEEYRQWLRMYRLFRDYPIDVIRSKGRERLPRVARHVNGEYYERLVRDWDAVLSDADPDRLRDVALEISQYGADMRQINPFKGIMSEEDRLQVIKDSRDEQR